MEKTNIIIFGANGMLGRYVSCYFDKHYNVIRITRKDIDIEKCNSNDLVNLLKEKKINDITYVVNCIGIIPQKHSLDSTKLYIKINSLFPHLLSHACSNLNMKLFHITTDCVFSGNKGNYNEYDTHDETNIYGVTKSLGEPDNCCVIRTSIIGEELEGKKSLFEWVKSNKDKKINGFTNHYWNGITCLQLAKILHEIVKGNKYFFGVRHIFSPNSVNKYELVNMINDIYKLNIIIDRKETNKIDKTLMTIYPNIFDIPDIDIQIKELSEFKLY